MNEFLSPEKNLSRNYRLFGNYGSLVQISLEIRILWLVEPKWAFIYSTLGQKNILRRFCLVDFSNNSNFESYRHLPLNACFIIFEISRKEMGFCSSEIAFNLKKIKQNQLNKKLAYNYLEKVWTQDDQDKSCRSSIRNCFLEKETWRSDEEESLGRVVKLLFKRYFVFVREDSLV